MNGVHVQEIDGCLIVSGQTYPIKDALKRLGFRWKGKEKHWKHPAASHVLRVQVAQVLGKTSLDTETQAPSNIHFHAADAREEEEDYYHDQVVNVHFEDDYYDPPPPQPIRQKYVQRARREPPPRRYSPEPRRVPQRYTMEELYVDQRPAVCLEVFCPSDDDEVFQ